MRFRGGPAALLILAFGAILWLTLKPIPAQAEATELTPWICLVCGTQGSADVLLNIALFVPLGAALACLGMGRVGALLVGAALSVAIELSQATLIAGRDPALGDVLANSLGSLVGASLAMLGPRLWRPSVSGARRLALAAGLAWLAMLMATAWLVLPAPAPDPPVVLVAPDRPLVEAFAGRVLGVTVDSQPLRLGARVVTGALTERAAPLVELTWPDSTVWARLAQLGQKGTFAVRLNATRLRLMTPEVRVHRAIPMAGSIAAEFRGMLDGGVMTAEVAVADSTHVQTRALTPGLGWALLLPFNYPLDHMGALPSAVWLALTLLPFGFWLGRSRHPPAASIAAAIVLLALGINASARLFHLPNDGIAAWLCCSGALLLGWVVGTGRIHHEDTKDAKELH